MSVGPFAGSSLCEDLHIQFKTACPLAYPVLVPNHWIKGAYGSCHFFTGHHPCALTRVKVLDSLSHEFNIPDAQFRQEVDHNSLYVEKVCRLALPVP